MSRKLIRSVMRELAKRPRKMSVAWADHLAKARAAKAAKRKEMAQ
jgi:hypothetical protein